MRLNINIGGKNVSVEAKDGGDQCPLKINISIDGVEVCDVVEQVGEEKLLDEIGMNKCMDYFGLAQIT